jgi:hypothetical protein
MKTSCSKLILAEFDFDGNPMETFGFAMNQAKESKLMYHLKKDSMPPIYWKLLIKFV